MAIRPGRCWWLIADRVEQIEPPSVEEIRLLGEEIDPTYLYI